MLILGIANIRLFHTLRMRSLALLKELHDDIDSVVWLATAIPNSFDSMMLKLEAWIGEMEARTLTRLHHMKGGSRLRPFANLVSN